MPRPLPRAFFWIDQALIRQGLYSQLSPAARLLYVALAATVDREGLCIWKKEKLMPLAGIPKVSAFESALTELEMAHLIQIKAHHLPPAIALCSLEQEKEQGSSKTTKHNPHSQLAPESFNSTQPSPLIVHTTIQIGEK